jgi:hypothetical protein
MDAFAQINAGTIQRRLSSGCQMTRGIPAT